MSEHSGFSMVLTTLDSEEKAEDLAKALIRRKLAACVQISTVRSFYEWNGEVSRDSEYLLRIKSRSALYEAIEKFLKENHPYDLPQIVEVPITNGLAGYFSWMEENTLP